MFDAKPPSRRSEPILLVRLKLRKKSCVLNHFKGIQKDILLKGSNYPFNFYLYENINYF